jgi:hypothetical protein
MDSPRGDGWLTGPGFFKSILSEQKWPAFARRVIDLESRLKTRLIV